MKNSSTPVLLGFVFLAMLFGSAVAILGGLVPVVAALVLLLVVLTLTDFRIGVLILIFLVPFQKTVWLPSFTGFNLINYFTVTTLAAVVANRLFRGIPVARFPRYMVWFYVVPILLATAYGARSVGQVPHYFLAIVESYETVRKYAMDLTVRPMMTVLLAWMLGTAVLNSRNPERFLIPVMLAPILIALPALGLVAWSGFDLGFLSSSSIAARQAMNRVGLHANTLGPLLATGLTLQVFVLPKLTGAIGRSFLLAGMSLTAVVLALTFSRGGYLIAAIGVFAFLIDQRKIRYLFYAVLALGLVAVPFGEAMFDRVSTGFGGGASSMPFSTSQPDALTAGRVMIWMNLLPDVLRSPLWGSGVGSIAWSRAVTSGLVMVGHPHNLYLHILMDMGVIGLAMMLYVFWKMYFSFRHWATLSGMPPALVAAFKGASAGFIGLLVNGFTNGYYIYDEQQLCIWLMFGIGLAYLPLRGPKPSKNTALVSGSILPSVTALNAGTPTYRALK
jgi:O-antigen ligase